MSTSVKCICEIRHPPQSTRDPDLLKQVLVKEDLFVETTCPSWYTQWASNPRFFQCRKCNHIWLYEEADGPWAGIWRKICICENSMTGMPEENAGFPRFLKGILTKSNLFKEIRREDVSQPNLYPLLGRVKRFFRCRKCRQRWQYSKPERALPWRKPRYGGWEPVD